MGVEFVDLQSNPRDLYLLERFFDELFVPGFPDPDERESLETLAANLAKRAAGFYGANNYRIILGVDAGRPIAACIADYMAASNCGAIEYIVVADDRRGEGLGRRIHDHAIEVLRGDAAAAGHAGLSAIMLEINDPFQVSPELDNVDPFERVMMWHHWGYVRLDFPYEQPALSAEQGAITYLLLSVRIIDPALHAGFPASLARQMVLDYLVWANRFDAFEADPYYRAMTAYAAAHPTAGIEPLDRYIGRDPALPLAVLPIEEPGSADFAAVMAVYRRAFPEGPTAIDPAAIGRRLAGPPPPDSRYHLWSFSAAPGAPPAGMATFFSMRGIGFLGYLVLEKPLRGRGLARVACKRIEERLIRDRADITHYYVECDPGSPQEAVFETLGFRRLDLDYRQPKLHGETGPGVPMSLLRKKLGAPLLEAVPTPGEIEAELGEIFRAVYAGMP